VERLTMTIQNANSGNAYLRFFGDQVLPNGIHLSEFACARFTPIEENRCVLSNPCPLDEFPDPALCGQIAALTPGVLSCVWQITPAIPGCPSELLEVRSYSTFGDASLSFSSFPRVVRQVPPAAVPLSPPILGLLAGILLGVGLATRRAGKR